MQAMNRFKRVKTAMSKRARNTHTFDTLLGHLPRGDRRPTTPPDLDPGLPVLLVRVGGIFAIQHHVVGVIRTLGRAGVPVYAVTEKGVTPASTSRFLTGQVKLSSGGELDQSALLDRLVEAVEELPAMPMLVCTDDEAAVLVAEGAAALAGRAIFPAVPPELPRQLASKRGLYEICRHYGVPTPATSSVRTGDDLEAALANLTLPVVVKQADSWSRLTRPVVTGSTVVRTAEDVGRLRAAFDRWPEGSDVIVQEYLPDEDAEDWFAHGYCSASSDVPRIFTARKFWSWPPRAGATAYARTERNEKIERSVRDLCRRIGYRGVFDTDWRYDRRSDTYLLLDFNPRVGAQFRIFEDDGGVDVVRAMHLDLSGRTLSPGRQVEGERFLVENLGLPARLHYRKEPQPPRMPNAPTRLRLAWFSTDDLRPPILMIVQQMATSVRLRLLALRSRSSAAS
jgi:predicted ATP-grasp superfamily ATP-dependent carboligase